MNTSDLNESQLRAKLERVKAIKEWLWIGIIICILALASLPLFAAQSHLEESCPCRPGSLCWPICAPISGITRYEIGALQSGTTTFKFAGEIGISDSTAYTFFNEVLSTYKVSSKANGNVYITDGTMTHTVRISQWPGKTSGYRHTTMITFVQDKRVGDVTAIYYCNVIP